MLCDMRKVDDKLQKELENEQWVHEKSIFFFVVIQRGKNRGNLKFQRILILAITRLK